MRLPKYAELSFARACSFGDAIAHRPDEDENGWDYLVEFPPSNHPGHQDTHPATLKAFVQVKSTIGSKLACSIKLSNALKASQSNLPWFLVLCVAPSRKSKPLRIYAKHLWKDEIAAMLRAVRAAEVNNEILSRKRITVSFRDADESSEECLVHWMRSCIDAVGSNYLQLKQSIYETVGFEDGYGEGNMSVVFENWDALLDNFLGLGDGLAGAKFSFTPSRFGINDKEPEVALKDALVRITPTSIDDCEIRLRGASPEGVISFPGKVYMVGAPILANESRRFRFSAPGVEIVWSPDGYSKFDLKLDYHRSFSLSELEKLTLAMCWAEKGPFDVQVWSRGRRIVGGTINDEKVDQAGKANWEKLFKILRMLVTFPGATTNANLSLTLAELSRSGGDLYFMYQMTGASSIAVTLVPLLELPRDAVIGVYYMRVQVGGWNACLVAERPLRSMIGMDDGQVRLEFGKDVIHEKWIARGDSDSSMIEGDYERLINDIRATGRSLFEFGDLAAMHKQGVADRLREDASSASAVCSSDPKK